MNEPFIAVRAVHFASTGIVAGVVIFRAFVSDGAIRRESVDSSPKLQAYQTTLRRIVWTSLAFAVVSGVAWFLFLAANINGRPLAEVFVDDTAWTLLTKTQFGHTWITRLLLTALLIACMPLSDSKHSRWNWLPALLAACLMGTLAWSGHAAATPGAIGDVHLTSDFFHLIAAGAWLGGLLPLALVLALARAAADRSWAFVAKAATRRFSTLGLLCVGTLLTTGIVNAWILVGSLHALFVTNYGKLLMLKVGLFLVMISIAAINRLSLTPCLPNANTARQLQRNALIEFGLGLTVIAIVGVLGILPPAAHMDMLMHAPMH